MDNKVKNTNEYKKGIDRMFKGFGEIEAGAMAIGCGVISGVVGLGDILLGIPETLFDGVKYVTAVVKESVEE